MHLLKAQVIISIYATVSDNCEQLLTFHLLQKYCQVGEKQRQRMISEKHFSLYSLENNETGWVSLYGLEGLIRREVGNQRPCGPTMRAVQQGLLAGAAPQGSFRSLSLLFSVFHAFTLSLAHSSLFRGPWVSVSRGSKTAE